MTTSEHGRASELRRDMVEIQLQGRDIADRRILDVMSRIPRHEFIPNAGLESSYGDHPMPIGWGQTISQPYMAALMTQKLGLKGGEKILEIGTGSGYQTAILAALCRSVVSMERIPQLYEFAAGNLKEYGNIRLILGDGSLGFPGESPYDRILVTAGAPEIPPALLEQLGNNGIMVIPVGEHGTQTLRIIRNKDGKISETDDTCCVFVPLIGEQGWH